MHRLIKRQLLRIFKDVADLPAWLQPFIESVNQAYEQFDDDRILLERSLELSSQELTQRNSEMRAVFQAFPDSFFWLDADGTIVDFKGGKAELSGLSPSSIIGKKIYDIAIASDTTAVMSALKTVRVADEIAVIEYSALSHGAQQHYEARFIPLVQGRVIGIIRNITSRKLGEEALKLAEEKYRTIFENAIEGLFLTTPEGKYVSANPAQAAIHGYESPDDLVRSVTDLRTQQYADPRDRDRIVAELRTSGEVKNREIRALRKDGTQIWASVNARAIHDADGNLKYIEGSYVDISSRKEAEASLQRSYEELERRVVERTAALTSPMNPCSWKSRNEKRSRPNFALPKRRLRTLVGLNLTSFPWSRMSCALRSLLSWALQRSSATGWSKRSSPSLFWTRLKLAAPWTRSRKTSASSFPKANGSPTLSMTCSTSLNSTRARSNSAWSLCP